MKVVNRLGLSSLTPWIFTEPENGGVECAKSHNNDDNRQDFTLNTPISLIERIDISVYVWVDRLFCGNAIALKSLQ